MHPADFDRWLERMKRLLDQKGIYYVGMVGHVELAKAYAQTGFVLYPTSFPETGCVALMKAQALGSVPVTSRYRDSTLPELTGRFDLGPPERAGAIENDLHWLQEWSEAVVRAATMPGIKEHRKEMIRWARANLLWGKTAALWHDAFLAVQP